MSHKNTLKFINDMKVIDWQCVFVENSAQSAYSKFHEIVSCKYNVCFSYRKLTKRYHMSKHWLSAALKQSIREENKLYILKNKQNDDERVLYYKKKRNKLNQLIRSAERKHYHNMLIEHKSNIKKSWQIIKSVINKRKYKWPAKKFKVMELLLLW